MVIVIKLGGSILHTGFPNVVADISELGKGEKFIFVHGGANEVTRIANSMGKEQKFVMSVSGFRSRYTDEETIQIFLMGMSKINKNLVLMLQTRGVQAIGLTGVDGLIMGAKRKDRIKIIDEKTGRKRIIDGDYTGKINKINTDLLNLLLDHGYVPVIAPIAVSENFEPLNVDGDRAAASVAAAIPAEKLILFTDVPGVLIDNKTVPELSLADAKNILDKIGAGMKKKIYAATEALEGGVKEVLIASGEEERPISTALSHSKCTSIYSF